MTLGRDATGEYSTACKWNLSRRSGAGEGVTMRLGGKVAVV
jgi:hypothetical protein